MTSQAPADPAEVVLLALARGALFTALVVVVACVTVRWLLPLALRLLRRPVQELVQLVGACLVLPEYWVSRAIRRVTSDSPPLVVYEYGHAVGWAARLVHHVVDRVFTVVANVAARLHVAVVGVAAGAVEIGLLVGWL